MVVQQEYFKKSTLNPQITYSGDSYEFVIRLTVGRDYTKGESRIVFDFPGTLGMSRPSFLHQEEPGFVEAFIENPEVSYETKIWDMEISDFASKTKTSWRGMGARTCVLDLGAGLKENDMIELRWGGSTVRVTTIVPRLDYESVIHVRYFKSHKEGIPDYGRSFKGYKRPDPITEIALPFKVLTRNAATLQLIRKTNKAMLVPRDSHWNVARVENDFDIVEAPENGIRNSLGVFEYFNKNIQIKSKKLPLLDTPQMDYAFGDYNIYWGDLHTHSCHSVDCVQREKMTQTPSDLMAYAKNCAGLDFYAVTDHHEPWNVSKNHVGKKGWDDLLGAIKDYNKLEEFIAFPGIEFRCKRGDSVVIFNWLPDYSEIDNPDLKDIRSIWKAFKGKDFLTIPHFHNPGKLPEGEWWESIDSGIEPVLEVFSCHGSYEREDAMEKKPPLIKSKRFDRYGNYFLKKGLHYGFCANSDGHKGVVGTNGITAVFSKSLDENSILEAYRKRHVYGTTNARIKLVFSANGNLMGSIVKNEKVKVLELDVEGESTLKKIDLFKNGDHFQRFIPDGKSFRREIKICEEEPSFWYARVTQRDNHMAYSSPIWFES